MEGIQAIMPTCAKRRATYARQTDIDDNHDDLPKAALNLKRPIHQDLRTTIINIS